MSRKLKEVQKTSIVSRRQSFQTDSLGGAREVIDGVALLAVLHYDRFNPVTYGAVHASMIIVMQCNIKRFQWF